MISLPIQQPVAIFFLVLLIILLVPLIVSRLRIPQVVGMIIVGIAVGPYGFNLLERDASFRIFGEVGILYIMFLAAVEIDMFHMRQQFKSGVAYGLWSFALPMVAGIFGSHYAFGVSWLSSFLIASMYASHTLVSYPAVSKFGLSNSRAAVIAVCGTIVAVLLALLTLAEVVTVRVSGHFEPGSLGRILVLMVVYMIVIGYGFPWLTRRFFSRVNDPVGQYIFILAMVFLASLLANVIGLEAILGAFYAGLVLNRLIPARSGLMTNIRFVGQAIFIPYFLIGVGMLINVRLLFEGWGVVWVASNMVIVALATKWLAAFIIQKSLRLSALDRNLIFGLSSGKAAATIAATMIGFKYGLLSEDVMNGAVVMILICCLVSSVVTERAAKKMRINQLEEDPSKTHDITGSPGQMVAVSNPLTAESLMKLAIMMRGPRDSRPVTTLFVKVSEDRRAAAGGASALRTAYSLAQAVDTPVQEVERYDLNVVSGIVNVSKEQHTTDIIVGMRRRDGLNDAYSQLTVEQLLQSTNRMVLMLRTFMPVDAVRRLMIIVPLNAEYERGFADWIERLGLLASQIDIRMVFMAHDTTRQAITRCIHEQHLNVRFEFRRLESWDDFILHSGEIGAEDLLVSVTARKGSISRSSELEQLGAYLSRHFASQNILVIYVRSE